MAGTRRLKQLVDEATGLLSVPDGPPVVALSGGADSAALAHLLIAGDAAPRAVHIDHRLPGSPRMREAALAVAGDLDMAIEVVEVDVEPGASPEGRARDARYQALAKVTTAEERVLTGHTADDNLETVLINLVRGTGVRGMAGIPPFRPPNIHRPMLEVTRSATREIASLAGLRFADDEMNLDPGLTRNYLRNVVIPRLTRLNPELVAAVGRMSLAVRADADFLDALAARIETNAAPGSTRTALGALAAAPRPLADRVILGMITEITGSRGATAGMLARVRQVVDGDARSVEVAAGVEARRHGAFLVLESSPSPVPETVDLLPGTTRHAGLVFETSVAEGVCMVAPLSRWQAVFPTGTALVVDSAGTVHADGEPAWVPGEERLGVAWYRPGTVGYLSVFAREESGWTSSP